MRFPKTVRFRKAEAKIYGKSKAYPFYRVCGYVAGKRRMTSFATYSKAKAAADKLVRDLAAGLQAAALTAKQASDALVSLQMLEAHYQATGKRLTLAGVVDAYTQATAKLNGHTYADVSPKTRNERRNVVRMFLKWAVRQDEISAGKSKTRSRRLVAICPALGQWLAPCRECDGLLWTQCLDKFHSDFNALRESRNIPARRNGLRHGFVSFHFALHSNENLTAALAGNSPAMIHAHYKGLATNAEAKEWFNVKPPKSAKNVIPLPAVSRKKAH